MTLPSLSTLLRTGAALLFALLVAFAVALRAGAQAPDGAQDEPPPGATHDNAQDAGEDAAESRATSFRAVDGAIREDVPGGMLVVGAYGAIAALLLLFLLRQQSQLRELDARIVALRGEIDRGASQKGNERA
ncbi:MAG: hypothetical protein R3B40_31875 [Polyangiales bacterium]|nr:hypothetical protein [Sandaracinaceae bacterium]